MADRLVPLLGAAVVGGIVSYAAMSAMRKSAGCTALTGPDPGGLYEYSVVYTDRALNHMSKKFQGVYKEIAAKLTSTYKGKSAVIIPGSGTYAMEAVARQFGSGKKCLVIRNGYFSFRWSDIFQACDIPKEETVMNAKPLQDEKCNTREFAPCPIEQVLAQIKKSKPDVVFAPHVETSAGIILPDGYLKQVTAAVHEYGGLFVLDCIASGCVWVDMEAVGVDIVITAPQKGWSGPACAGYVVMNEKAEKLLVQQAGNVKGGGFTTNLFKWYNIAQAYEKGGHAYYTTMPTDALAKALLAMRENAAFGFDKLAAAQWELGREVRKLLAEKGYPSVAAKGFEAPGVVVVYSPRAGIAGEFLENGIQIAAGVPLMVGNGTDSQNPGFQTFRLGLFGLDKLGNIPRTVQRLRTVLDKFPPPNVPRLLQPSLKQDHRSAIGSSFCHKRAGCLKNMLYRYDRIIVL
eukprot:g55900.t1